MQYLGPTEEARRLSAISPSGAGEGFTIDRKNHHSPPITHFFHTVLLSYELKKRIAIFNEFTAKLAGALDNIIHQPVDDCPLIHSLNRYDLYPLAEVVNDYQDELITILASAEGSSCIHENLLPWTRGCLSEGYWKFPIASAVSVPLAHLTRLYRVTDRGGNLWPIEALPQLLILCMRWRLQLLYKHVSIKPSVGEGVPSTGSLK